MSRVFNFIIRDKRIYQNHGIDLYTGSLININLTFHPHVCQMINQTEQQSWKALTPVNVVLKFQFFGK